VCRLFKVSGKVQGVFFRASTRQIATGLGLTGCATNMPDNSVEVLACGSADAIDQLLAWLRNGPPMASVDGVQEVTTNCANPDRFTIV